MKRNQGSLTAMGIAVVLALEKLYFSTGDRPRHVADGYAIASAVVKPQPANHDQ